MARRVIRGYRDLIPGSEEYALDNWFYRRYQAEVYPGFGPPIPPDPLDRYGRLLPGVANLEYFQRGDGYHNDPMVERPPQRS